MNMNKPMPINNSIGISLNPSIKLQRFRTLKRQGIGLNKSLSIQDYQSLKDYKRLKEQTIKLNEHLKLN